MSIARNLLPLLGIGVALAFDLPAATFVVTHAGDSGPGSLREAIHSANGNPGPDDIHFNIPGAGPHVIALDSQLPHVDGHGTEIRGDTQPGYVDRPVVALNGARFGVVPFSQYRGGGIIFYGNDCLVRGLAFGGFRMQPGQQAVVRGGWHGLDEDYSCAVRLHGDNGRVEDCHFGLDAAGGAVTQNGLDAGNTTGVLVRGGTSRIERNLFGLNSQGVWLYEHSPGGTIRSNQFGLFRDGVSPVNPADRENRFSHYGIRAGGSRGISIRGNRFAALRHGAWIVGSSGIQVFGNLFGLGRDGSAVPMNGGIEVAWTDRLQIGSDADPIGRNYFCSHIPFTTTSFQGMYRWPAPAIFLGTATEGVVAGNTFGENPAGAARPNGDTAVRVTFSPGSDVYAYKTNPVTVTVRGNRITHSQRGIVAQAVREFTPVTVLAHQNEFVNLTGLAIDNGDDGPTPPDPLDLDQGASGLQNQPEIQTITYDSITGYTRVTGLLRSRPASRYTLELLRMPMAAGNPPEAHASMATQVVTTDPFGNADFAFSVPGLFVGQAFSATATPADAIAQGFGGTSELADAVIAPSGSFRLIGGGALTEGGGTVRNLTVTRTGTYGPASVRLQITGSHPGASASDYMLSEGPVLHFASGERSKTVTVQAVDDDISEPFEVYTVELTDLVNAFGASGLAVFSIIDNDLLPVLSVADVAVTEGEQAVLRLRLSGPSQHTVTADYLWWNASAIFGEDFFNVFNSTATFLPGVTEVMITADTIDDVVAELPEWFGFSVGNVVNASLAPESARIIGITINDNDTPPDTQTGFRFSWISPEVYVGEGDGEVGLMVLRTGSLAGEARVWLRRTAGTASLADFAPNTDEEIVFAPGEGARLVSLGVINDELNEPDETFFTTLFNPTAAIGSASLEPQSSLTWIITDNDGPPSITVENVTKTEGDSGVTDVNVAVTLSAPSGRELVIGLVPVGGTATVGEDYLPVFGSVTLAPGEMTGVFTVGMVGDRIYEAAETILLEPVVLIGGTHPLVTGVFTIKNDDSTNPVYELEDLPVLIPESAGTLTLTLRRYGNVDDASTCRVKIGDADVTLQLDETDYTFEPGQQTRTVSLRVQDDALDELDENGSLVVLPGSPGEAPVSNYPVVILDDDEPPTVFVEGPDRIIERDSTEVTAAAAVRLSAPSRLPIEVKVITTGTTAVEGVDYKAVSVVLTFLPGETVQALDLTVLGDRADEGDEEFLLLVISASNATLGSGGLRVIIEDNDLPLRPYRDWLAGHFTPAERSTDMTDPCADPDGDRLSNALEFFLDSNPRSALSGPDRFTLFHGPDALVWTWTGLRSRDAFAGPSIEVSADLVSWTPLDLGLTTIYDFDPDGRQYKIALPYDTHAQRFLKLGSACRPFEPEAP